MSSKTVLALVLGCAFMPALHAQQLYKCGSTYSQTPCGADAQQKKLSSSQAADAAPGAQGLELCVAHAQKQLKTQAEHARIRQIGSRVAEPITYADKLVTSHRYDLELEVRQLNGMFGSPARYGCWLSEDQRRVLRFSTP